MGIGSSCRYKTDGSIRITVDLKSLNAVIKGDVYPLPNRAEIYKKLSDSGIFSKIDLKAAYHQIPKEELSIELTAFTCEFGLYEYLSMPMGIKNAPAWFQRFVEETFRDFIERKVLSIYLDDTILHTESLSHHKDELEQIFERISKNFIKCSYNKSSLVAESICINICSKKFLINFSVLSTNKNQVSFIDKKIYKNSLIFGKVIKK